MVGLFDLSKYVLGEAHTLKVIWTYESHRHPHTIGSHLFYISSGAAIDSAVITPNIPFENDRSNSIWKSTHWIEGGHSSWTFAWLMAMVIKSVIKYFFPPFLIPPPPSSFQFVLFTGASILSLLFILSLFPFLLISVMNTGFDKRPFSTHPNLIYRYLDCLLQALPLVAL